MSGWFVCFFKLGNEVKEHIKSIISRIFYWLIGVAKDGVDNDTLFGFCVICGTAIKMRTEM